MSNKVVICGVDTSTLPKLSEEQSKQYLIEIAKGNSFARECFIVANMRLVLSVIKRFWAKKLSSDDVFQAGCIGLIKAIDNFDNSFGVKFSTYAVPLIIGEIKRFLRDGNSLRISRSIRDMAYQVLKTRGEIEKRKEQATLEKIASEMKVAVSEVAYALDAISDTISIYEPVYDKAGDTLLLLDRLSDEKNTDEKWTEICAVETAITSLPDREKRIIFLRYYEGRTQTEISEEIGISQAQVSRLEKTAIKYIKNKLEYV